MKQKTLTTSVMVIVLLVAATAVLNAPRPALGQMTIPTRTPKPDTPPTDPPPEPEPTDDNGGGGGNPSPTEPAPEGTEPPPAATSTAVLASPTATTFAVVPPVGSATPTATVAASVSPSPAAALLGTPVAFPGGGAAFPTAAVCGRPPTFQARSDSGASAYAGPSEAYAEVGLIGRGEARPIIGRAAFVPWWVVQLDSSGRSGWVAGEMGTVQGDIGRVPIVSAPDLNGVAPTPAPNPWVPTPNPDCAAAVSGSGAAASGAVATAAEAGNTSADTGEALPPSGDPVITAVEEAPAAAAASAAATLEGGLDLAGETSGRRAQGDAGAAAGQIVADLAGRAEPLEIAPQTAAPELMPIAGLVLVIAAVVLGVYLRRGSGSRAN